MLSGVPGIAGSEVHPEIKSIIVEIAIIHTILSSIIKIQNSENYI